MAELKGSRTEKNLLTAFAGESQARNRYTYFASAAKKEGLELVSRTFAEIADQEKEHAKRFFSMLQGGEVEITAAYPAGIVGKSAQNLLAAANGEKFEHTKMYPDMATVADEEGFPAIAALYRMISVAETEHERRYRALLALLEKCQMFIREKPVKWRCLNCGYTHEGTEPPGACPACAHPQAYFEAL
jgi:rubrerythrin